MFASALDAILSPEGWRVEVGDDGVLAVLGDDLLVYRGPRVWDGWDRDEQEAVGVIVARALLRAAAERRRGLVRVAVTAGPHGWSASVVP